VVGNAHAFLQHGHRIRDVLLLDDAVRMAVDVGVVRDGHAVAQHDAAAIIQQYVAMHHDIVSHVHVVAERKFHVLEAFEVAPAATEDVRCQHAPEFHPRLHVLAAGGKPVERIP
jgi:hypothetical protein